MMLENIAEVLRFQDPREHAGDLEDAGYVFDEIRPENIDPLTGFVHPYGLSKTALFKMPKKYQLKPHDIVMYFNGSAGQLGTCGLVLDKLAAVPSRTLCIIRAFSEDPVGLFFWLRRPEIRHEIARQCGRASTGAKSFITQESLRRFDVDPQAIRKAVDAGYELIEGYLERREENSRLVRDIDAIFGGAHESDCQEDQSGRELAGIRQARRFGL